MRRRQIIFVPITLAYLFITLSLPFVSFAADGDEYPKGLQNTGAISSEYGGHVYTDPDGHTWAAVANKGIGDNKPADGGAGHFEGIEKTVTETKASDEEHSAVVSETRSTPGTSGTSIASAGPKTTVVEHRTEGTIDITKYSDGSERVVITTEDKTKYTKDTYSDGTYVVKADREYLPGDLKFADGSEDSGLSGTRGDLTDSKDSAKGAGKDSTSLKGKGDGDADGSPGTDAPKASGLDSLKAGFAASGAGELLSLADGFLTGSSGTGEPDLRSVTIDKSDYEDGKVTAHITKTDAEGRTYSKIIEDSIDRWKDVPKTIFLDDGREVARPQSTTEYLKATVYEPEEKTVTSTGKGSVDLTYKTADGESHTIHYKKGDGTVSYVSVVTDGEGREVALVHTFRETGGDREDVTSLGYEWSVQNFTDESSPYYGRYVSRTQPIPSASRGGRDKGGLLPVGNGVFNEVFVNYGEHTMMVTHYFNVDVYTEYEECDDGDCDTYEVYEYSYITKDPPEYYDFHVPLVCLDCVPPAPGVRVCIGGGCDCINTENLVCDTEHSTERYMDIETHTELER